eukprot:1161301-Pelagomonas_calceolata.AAC.11
MKSVLNARGQFGPAHKEPPQRATNAQRALLGSHKGPPEGHKGTKGFTRFSQKAATEGHKGTGGTLQQVPQRAPHRAALKDSILPDNRSQRAPTGGHKVTKGLTEGSQSSPSEDSFHLQIVSCAIVSCAMLANYCPWAIVCQCHCATCCFGNSVPPCHRV